MKIIRRKQFFVKTERGLTNNGLRSENKTVLCPHCGESMTDVRTFGGMLDLSFREVFRLIVLNRIHFCEIDK